jgi:hypothetical protein
MVSTQCHNSVYQKPDGASHTDTGGHTKILYFHDIGTSTGGLFDFDTVDKQLSHSSDSSSARDGSTGIIYYSKTWVTTPGDD